MTIFTPARIRLALLLVVAGYPVIPAYLYALGALTASWEMWQRTLLLVPMMVLTIVFVLMPAIQKQFGSFIAGGLARRAMNG